MAKAKTAAKGKRTRSSTVRTESATSKRSIADHSEHPENPADSTVRHTAAPSAGFPQGEYDVTEPSKAAGRKQSIEESLLAGHTAGQDVNAIKTALKQKGANRLSADQRALALEALPLGAVIEHEGPNRWRVKGPVGGANRFGHGATAQEAIESYVLGNASASIAEAGVLAFKALPASQQKEIEDRDEKAARRVGQSADSTPAAIARQESLESDAAARSAKPAAINASSDGAERASAVVEAGQKRSAARKRSGSPKRKGK